jgi:hypothetical protein
MLEAVLAAANTVGPTWVVSPERVEGATWIPDPGGGQGAAVDDRRALHDAIPEGGMAIAEARDGTTNALGLSDVSLFAPLYGPGSAERFRAHTEHAADVVRAGLRDDVDTPADLATA